VLVLAVMDISFSCCCPWAFCAWFWLVKFASRSVCSLQVWLGAGIVQTRFCLSFCVSAQQPGSIVSCSLFLSCSWCIVAVRCTLNTKRSADGHQNILHLPRRQVALPGDCSSWVKVISCLILIGLKQACSIRDLLKHCLSKLWSIKLPLGFHFVNHCLFSVLVLGQREQLLHCCACALPALLKSLVQVQWRPVRSSSELARLICWEVEYRCLPVYGSNFTDVFLSNFFQPWFRVSSVAWPLEIRIVFRLLRWYLTVPKNWSKYSCHQLTWVF
jgi:hypothetical protein